ncbi:MAG: TetR/AcrR family transcriptional regulator [Chloroflexi bacterium]|nr:TetR/AcrR family transcriptional regulator [Chloroflexota bacterium]
MKTAPKPFAPQTRRERNRAEMRAAILDAARAVMRQDGVAALNLNKVAAQIGIKTPSLYEYFDGKMAIYDALFRRGIEIFGEYMAPALEQEAWSAGLRAFIEAYMQFALANPELYQLCFERPVPGFVPSEESMRTSLDLLEVGRKRIAQWIQAQGSSPLGLTPAMLNDLSIAVAHGITAQHMANEPHLPIGKGRYGSLIPAAVALFQAAWDDSSERAALASTRKTRAHKKERQK